MPGKVVQATNLDVVGIEVCGEGKAVALSASLILAADRVMRSLGMDTNAMLTIEVVQTPNDGPRQWRALLHGREGWSMTPWGAIKELADKLEAS